MNIQSRSSILKSLLLIMLVVNIIESKSLYTNFKSVGVKIQKDSIGLVTVDKGDEEREERNRKSCAKQFEKCLQEPSIYPDKYDYCRTRMIQSNFCRKFYLNN
jgi:hypothetical protein